MAMDSVKENNGMAIGNQYIIYLLYKYMMLD